ncbi:MULTISPECIES: Hpt domain-containing protein [unclassified Psychrobacter]|uniref:Hpt domain-containing protein n=1 Tax=unclassified Psychrobacter TaxID=196806 RepID=UPI00071E861F|nr:MULTISPECIES: Hpt domain-containing protein [unclassified Psychrobacter]OLF38411.1 histidine kinase [Psychrobacter sp. Cmf 22.2]
MTEFHLKKYTINNDLDNDIIDHEQFEDLRDLFEEDFELLIRTYITDSKQRIVTLRTAQKADDNANGFEIAHALKGASANIGATQLIVLSHKLQEHCRERKIDQQANLIEDIALALQHVELEINKRLNP